VNAVLDDPQKVWTYEDYLALNEDTVFEIIDGKAFMSPAPELLHQRWARKIFLAVERHIESRNLGEVFFAPVDVVLDEKNVVQPDLVYVSTAKAGILERRGIMGAPGGGRLLADLITGAAHDDTNAFSLRRLASLNTNDTHQRLL
jgi:hypothetical protein